MPGSMADFAGPAQAWAAGAVRQFDMRPSDIYRGVYIVVRGTITCAAGFTLPDRISAYGARLIEQVEIIRDAEQFVRQAGIAVALEQEYDGWNSATLNNIPGAAGAGTFIYERVYAVRFNPDDLMSIRAGMNYEVDMRSSANLVLRVTCGANATTFGANQTFGVNPTINVLIARDFTRQSLANAQAMFRFRRRVITTQQFAVAAGVVNEIRLPRDGMLRRVSIAAVDANAHLSDAVFGRVQMQLAGGAYPFDGPFASFTAQTRARAAKQLTGAVDLSATGAQGGFCVWSFDDDGAGMDYNVVDAAQAQPILQLTGAAAGTVWVTSELLRLPALGV